MGRVVIGDLVTGGNVADVPFSEYKWEVGRNRSGSTSFTVPLRDRDVVQSRLKALATPGMSFLGIIEGDNRVIEAGPLDAPEYSKDNSRISYDGVGLRSIWDEVPIMPPKCATANVDDFFIADPENDKAWIANPTYSTVLSGMDHGSIGFSLVRQQLSWPGGQLPIDIPNNRAGTRQQSYSLDDFKMLNEALDDLSAQEAGPDFAFLPYLTDDKMRWQMLAGTEAEPVLRGTGFHTFDMTTPDSPIRALKQNYTRSVMGSYAWELTRGENGSKPMISRAYDPYLLDRNYPLQHRVGSSHGTVTDRGTLDRYAQQAVREGRTLAQSYSFQVEKSEWLRLNVSLGDRCKLIIYGDPILPDGEHPREVAAMTGDHGRWVTITTVAERSAIPEANGLNGLRNYMRTLVGRVGSVERRG